MHRISLIVSFAALAVAAPLGAQQLGPSKVPEGHKPPPGMCRIWIDGVPPGRQSAPTDCPTAVRNRPSNGRVIWGDDDRKREPDRPTRPADDRDDRRGSDGRERERPRPPEPREPRESDKPRETRESPKPRETSKEQPEGRRPATKSRKPDDDSEDRKSKPERGSDRRKPDFSRKPN